MNSENAISHIHVNKRSLGLVTTILAVLQNSQVMRLAAPAPRRAPCVVGATHTHVLPHSYHANQICFIRKPTETLRYFSLRDDKYIDFSILYIYYYGTTSITTVEQTILFYDTYRIRAMFDIW